MRIGIGSGSSGGSVDPNTLIGRAGVENIADATQDVEVEFSSPMPNASYGLGFSIKNSDDTPASHLQGVVTVKTTDGFTVRLNAPTDSANYKLDYIAAGAI